MYQPERNKYEINYICITKFQVHSMTYVYNETEQCIRKVMENLVVTTFTQSELVCSMGFTNEKNMITTNPRSSVKTLTVLFQLSKAKKKIKVC